MGAQVSNALTLVMTIESPQKFTELNAWLSGVQTGKPEDNPITKALNKLQIVHFARFVFLCNNTQLAVITTYDGDFETYIDAFINEIGPVFDTLLSFMKGGAGIVPVSGHRAEFAKYVKINNVPCVGNFYSAYPDLEVMDILTLKNEQGKA